MEETGGKWKMSLATELQSSLLGRKRLQKGTPNYEVCRHLHGDALRTIASCWFRNNARRTFFQGCYGNVTSVPGSPLSPLFVKLRVYMWIHGLVRR